MKGRLYIDGKDIYSEYGVYVVKGGWNELIAYPPLKSVESNDWQEMDGIEADLSSPMLDTREIQLKVAFTGLDSRFFALIRHLSDGAYHTFDCRHIERTYRLRLVAQPNLAVAHALGTTTLKLADDFPLHDYTYKKPASNMAAYNDYTFDGMKFTAYGVRVLKGTLDEVIKMPTVKTNLLRNISTQAGVLYDGKNVSYKSKDVKINCLMRADTLEELWRNYDALLYDLIRPNERKLWVDELGQEFIFYYKSCQVTEFYPTDKIWLQFILTVTFTTWNYIDTFKMEYDQFEYIENRSNAFIDTGYIFGKFDKKVEIRFQQIGDFKQTHLFGASSNQNSNYILNPFGGYSVWVGGNPYTIMSAKVGDTYNYTLEIKNRILTQTVNGIVTTATVPNVTAERSLYLFDVNSGKKLSFYKNALIRLFSAKIYDSGIAVRDYVPAKRKRDGAIGLFDKIERKFYMSPNGTEFIGE